MADKEFWQHYCQAIVEMLVICDNCGVCYLLEKGREMMAESHRTFVMLEYNEMRPVRCRLVGDD